MLREHTITLGAWEFVLSERSGQWFLAVPDCGGVVDSFPRVPEQHAVERLFREHGARWPSLADP